MITKRVIILNQDANKKPSIAGEQERYFQNWFVRRGFSQIYFKVSVIDMTSNRLDLFE